MANRSGSIYALTVLTPIAPGPSGDGSHAMALRAYLRSLPCDGESPLARVPGTHMARLVVMDDVPYAGAPSKEDHLESAYLLFVAEVDGQGDDYLTDLARCAPGFVDGAWGHCRGYPGVVPVRSFVAYMKRCQLETTSFFADVSDRSVGQRLEALRVQALLRAFVAGNQERSPGALQRAFRSFLEEAGLAPHRAGDARAPARASSAPRTAVGD